MKPLYIFQGRVIRGQSRGRDLGFPTANNALHLAIPEGIYAAEVEIDQSIYHAATFIGVAQTFDEIDYKAESYILDFNQDIYDQMLTVRLYKQLRGNKKFDSVEDLVAQMHIDILATRKFFSEGL